MKRTQSGPLTWRRFGSRGLRGGGLCVTDFGQKRGGHIQRRGRFGCRSAGRRVFGRAIFSDGRRRFGRGSFGRGGHRRSRCVGRGFGRSNFGGGLGTYSLGLRNIGSADLRFGSVGFWLRGDRLDRRDFGRNSLDFCRDFRRHNFRGSGFRFHHFRCNRFWRNDLRCDDFGHRDFGRDSFGRDSFGRNDFGRGYFGGASFIFGMRFGAGDGFGLRFGRGDLATRRFGRGRVGSGGSGGGIFHDNKTLGAMKTAKQ